MDTSCLYEISVHLAFLLPTCHICVYLLNPREAQRVQLGQVCLQQW